MLNRALGEETLVVNALSSLKAHDVLNEGEERSLVGHKAPLHAVTEMIACFQLEDVEDRSFGASRLEILSPFQSFLCFLFKRTFNNHIHVVHVDALLFLHLYLLSLYFICLLLGFLRITLGFGKEAWAFKDEELAAIADIDKFECLATETLAHVHELNWSLEVALEVEYKEATAKVSQKVVLADERDIVHVVFTTLRQNVHEGEVTKWLHHDTVPAEVMVTFIAVG
jgi:hypothetical protein